eukprot:COSAG01_NODE_1793_length_9215_cov_16.655002_4_plen_58_part_00
MVAHLETNSQTTAVCGRQRVMSATVQYKGTKKAAEYEWWTHPYEYALRQIQTYDFEA